MTARPFRLPLLAWAILLGVVVEIPLIAFSLHIGLLFAGIAGNNNWVYWALNGALFAVGLGTGLVVVPWYRLRVRIICAVALVMMFAAWGAWHA